MTQKEFIEQYVLAKVSGYQFQIGNNTKIAIKTKEFHNEAKEAWDMLDKLLIRDGLKQQL